MASIGGKEITSPSVDDVSERKRADGDLDGTKDQQYLKQKEKSMPFHKLFSYADPADYVLMFVGMLAAVGNGIAVPLMTVIFGNVINAFGQNATNSHDLVSDVSKVALTFVYLGLGNGVASFLQVACWTVTGERQASRIRGLYLKSILRQDIAYFDKEVNTGEIVGRMSGDILLVQDAMGEKVGLFIQSVSSFLGGFVVALIKGWELALVMLGTIPLIVLFAAAMSTIITKTAAHGQQTTSEAAAVAEQAISSIRTVASFTGEEQAVKTYSKFLTSAYESSVLEGLASGIGLGATFAMAYLGYSLGIWVGSTLIMHKGYNGGEVINVMFAVAMGSMSLGQAAPSTTAFAAGQAAAAKMFDTINRIPEIDADGSEGKTLESIRGDIELKDVCFSYPTRPDDQILTGLSLFVPSATTVALVGESGSGKSTVISLIERFYDPVAGEVLVDGINLKDFHLRWIRMKIGLVSQEPILTASSIRENIAYSKEDATTEEIWAAAELANASKFIGKLPQGLETMVGDGGIQLSGGQKQRIAIARAVLKDPRILLLDEATSSLDVKSERLVQEALERIMSNRTTLLVAHRLSTVENADIIAVMHRGSIVEKGSHSELLKDPNGSYSRLISLQEVSFNQSSEENYAQEEEEEEEDIMLVGDYDHQLPSQLSKHGQKSPGEIVHSLSESFASPAGPGIQDKNLQGPKSDEASDQYKQVPLSRLAKLNKPEIPVILLGIVASIVSGVIFPVFGALLGSIVHTFYEPPPKLQRDSNFWSLMLLILALGTLISMPARAYFSAVAGSNLICRIRSMCFKRVVHMEIAWFDVPKNSAGVIGARLSADASAVRNLVGDTLSVVVQNASTFVCGLAIAFSSCWQLSLIILAMIPLMGLNGWIQMQLLQGYSSSVKVMHQEASRLASDAVRGIRTVASFSAEEKVMKLYKQRCEGPMVAGMKQGLISGIGFGFSFFLLFGSYALSFYAGARLVGNGESTFADIFRVFFALSFAAIGISQSSSLLPDATKAKSATASVFALLDGSSKIDSSSNTGMTLELVEGNIVFQNVSFAYPTRPGIQILRDLCLSVQSGETVALVGESGSGKSTIVSLLQRFYDADSGDIMIDGVEIKKFQLRWLRQQIGLVSQEPVLFNDSIRANIAYGKGGEATEAEILAAARLANADQFISGLHQGYDTLVGERGVQLSGGQKQRIAIARAIIKEPKILLLDEATSALDAQSERVVQTSLERVMTNRTAIVIAHRLSTVRGADLIAVIRNGAVEEKGKHEALIKINGVYASLVAIQ